MTALSLLQLVSPALPVGAFSYSEGLEVLIQAGASTAPNQFGCSCLHIATLLGAEVGAVKRLLELRVAPDSTMDYRWSPFGVFLFAASLPHRVGSKDPVGASLYHAKGATLLT